MRALRRFWLLTLACIVVGLLIGGVVYLLSPKVYQSMVTFYISAQAGMDNATMAYQGSLLSEQRVASYRQLLTSPRVLDEVIRQLNLTTTPSDLSKNMSATSQTDTILIDLTVNDRDAAQASAIANSTASVFVDVVNELERPTRPGQPPVVAVRVVQPAQVSLIPISPRLTLDLTFGVLFGGLVGFALAFALQLLDNKVRTIEDLSAASDSAKLGTVRVADPQAGDSEDGSSFGVHEAFEDYRRLRTNLQFLGIDSPSSVILVSSALAGEGKTTVSSNLALALGQAGYRVALVDADLRKPRLHEVIGTEGQVGLTSLLTGSVSLEAATQRWKSNVAFIASGTIPPNPSELLGSDRMSRFLDDLRARYDYVILDCPPILPVTDSAVLSGRVDGVLLVSTYGLSTINNVRDSVEAVRMGGGEVRACVLNRVPEARGKYGYTGYGYPGEKGGNTHRLLGPQQARESARNVDTDVTDALSRPGSDSAMASESASPSPRPRH